MIDSFQLICTFAFLKIIRSNKRTQSGPKQIHGAGHLIFAHN